MPKDHPSTPLTPNELVSGLKSNQPVGLGNLVEAVHPSTKTRIPAVRWGAEPVIPC